MIKYSLLLILILSQHELLNALVPANMLKRFEYKLSFKGPHLVFKDGTIPFWTHSGSTIASNDQIRITPSLKSQKGSIWSNMMLANPDWEIETILKISGRGRIGADGMVFIILYDIDGILIIYN